MSHAAWFEATIGRRLLIRIWAHGVLLFVGVLVMTLGARAAMTELDAAAAIRMHPYLAVGVVDRAFAQHPGRAELARAIGEIERETELGLAVFAADGAALASSRPTARLTPPTPGERAALAAGAAYVAGAQRIVTRLPGAAGELAVIALPRHPSALLHITLLVIAAFALAFVFVAAPLARSIARPIERLGALTRELGAGNLAVRAPVDRHDELGDLARSFNAMALQIQGLRAAERELLGGVSHELRTPLARIRVVLDLAGTADLDHARRYLHEIAIDLSELEQLIDDIIASARLDRAEARWDEAQPPLRREPVAVRALVTATCDRFRAAWPARRLDCPPVDPGLTLVGDATLLRRVLDNLVDNARKFSPDDAPITIAVGAATLAGGPAVRVEVIDRGIGIAAGDHPRVFSPLFRADRSRARETGGVGLGLSLARRIVVAHGGTIEFASEPDHGSRFWFTIAVSSAACNEA